MDKNDQMLVKPDINLDELEKLEEQFAKEQEAEGYRHGLDMGKKAGEEEGRALGSIEGAKIGSELGYLYGFSMTHKQLLNNMDQNESATSSSLSGLKSSKTLDEILRLIEEFPRTNRADCEEKLAQIRVKFRKAFVNVPTSQS